MAKKKKTYKIIEFFGLKLLFNVDAVEPVIAKTTATRFAGTARRLTRLDAKKQKLLQTESTLKEKLRQLAQETDGFRGYCLPALGKIVLITHRTTKEWLKKKPNKELFRLSERQEIDVTKFAKQKETWVVDVKDSHES